MLPLKRTVPILFCFCFLSVYTACAAVPLIYCSDLFHPHDDPDDHFDLACIYAIEEFDLKAIILDQGLKQKEQPGIIPVMQMNALTGREVPSVSGLEKPLNSPEDAGEDQPASAQAGVETILAILRESPDPVTIITVGSLRDVAAAFNRDAALFHQKLKRLYAFIGNTGGGFREYNVNLDLNAYRCIMNAGLPLYWTPCFDGGLWENNGRASYWVSPHNQLLEGAPEALLNFFIYMIEKKDSADPVAALFEPVNGSQKTAFLAEKRNLWCCAVFPHASDRFYICRKGKYLALPPHSLLQGDRPAAPFSYVPVKVRLDEEGVEHCPDPDGTEILCFHMTDPQSYARHMTEISAQLLHELAGLIRTPEK